MWAITDDCSPPPLPFPDGNAFSSSVEKNNTQKTKQTASHHLDKGSILKMVINSLEECIMNYVPQVLPPKVDSI